MKIVISTTALYLRMSGLVLTTALCGPAAAGENLPFKERSSGILTSVGFDAVAGEALTHIEGAGHATHLGHFTAIADVAVNVVTGVPHGTWTLTAANGDQLFLDMGGHGIDAFHGFGTFTITGGTGRFEDATGYYEQIVTFAVPLGSAEEIPYTEVSAGTISFN